MNIISVYAPEDNKPKKERELFYDQLQETVERQPANEAMIVLGDFNARIGSEIIPGINSDLMRRGQTSTIDYILSNRHIHPAQVRDVRTLNSANVNSDHRLLMGKVKLKLPLKRNNKTNRKEQKLNVESLWHDSTRVYTNEDYRKK
ncbi:craniofacial development protein 2-like [Harmonia axyridis]|uniref:craniofacial development protein 2-like n=1 Tax=Harmonia axyridis TaxID=115357 RepID=UPI001E27782F|nr:craniofacial development protein 2-like [Harmonia axyridis]